MSGRGTIRTIGLAASFSALAVAALVPPPAGAAERCAGDLQKNVCVEATGSCPATGGQLGLLDTAWPVFQRNVQHTGKTDRVGPTCSQPTVLWKSKLRGRVLSPPVIGAAPAGQQGQVYVGASLNPVCSLDPATGASIWCGTDQLGRDAGFASPALGNGLLYQGTRDNDLWAIDLPASEASGAEGTVVWREKVCTDGDVTSPPVIGADGVIYFSSDSLKAGSLFAMCPGTERRVKWCINPVGGAVSNVSPALSGDGSRLYATFRGCFLASYDSATGAEKWRLKLERRRNGGRSTSFTPVVDPTTGRVYVGFDEGLFAIDTRVVDGKETGVPQLLYPAYAADGQRVNSPPALDLARQTIYFGATSHRRGTLYAVSMTGQVKWKKELGRGIFKANPPVVDGNGNVYVALLDYVYAFDASGKALWTHKLPAYSFAPPVITQGRLYIGTKRGAYLYALGCP